MTKLISPIKQLLSSALLLFTATIFAQDFAKVDQTVQAYPASFSSIEKLADKIKTDFSREDEKARAIYTWIALHVKYDLAAVREITKNRTVAYSYSSQAEKLQKEAQFKLDMAEKTLKSKKAVCQGYSSLYRTLCEMTGLKCIDIPGTSKVHPTDIGKLPVASDHMWNAVKIGNEWKLIDVTWGAGSVNGNTGKYVARFNEGYFFTDPAIFFLNHFPDDKRLIMLPKSPEEFAELPLFYGEYIKGGYQVTFPDKGILNLGKANTIPFKILDLPDNIQLTYAFTSNRISNLITPTRDGNTAEFEIPVTAANKGFLTIFADNRSIVTYKIMR